MKNFIIKLKQHSKYDTIVSWGKLISITGSAQIIVQAVGFASGILIIRLLPVQEYAFYTLANTMLGTMTVLADSGITAGVMAQGGKVWQNNEKMGVVLATGLDLRKKFAIGSLLFSMPFLFYLLIHNGASWLTSVLIALALIPAFYTALSDSLLEIVPKLHQTILPLQKNQVAVGFGRLFLTALTMFVFPWAFIGILAAGIPRLLGNIQLRKISYDLADKNQQPDKKIRFEILGLVKKTLPTSIYFCVSGQITIWLISIFGNTTSLAQLGALGRISAMLAILATITWTLIIPRFARLPMVKKIVLKRFVQILGLLIVLLCSIVIFVFVFPTPILWLLGDAYNGLPFELLLSIISSCIGLLGGIVFHLYSSRGWAISPALSITIDVSSIVILASIIDLSSIKGILFLNIGVNLISFLQTLFFSIFKINQLN